jgi:cytochrome c556
VSEAVQPTVPELVAARQAGMHMAATLLYQNIAPRAKGTGDLGEVAFSEGLEMWSAAIPGLFPAGSAHPQSRALPAIWASKADFDQKAADMGAAARDVSAAGKAGDLQSYAAAVERLRQTCSACHALYRAP